MWDSSVFLKEQSSPNLNTIIYLFNVTYDYLSKYKLYSSKFCMWTSSLQNSTSWCVHVSSLCTCLTKSISNPSDSYCVIWSCINEILLISVNSTRHFQANAGKVSPFCSVTTKLTDISTGKVKILVTVNYHSRHFPFMPITLTNQAKHLSKPRQFGW